MPRILQILLLRTNGTSVYDRERGKALRIMEQLLACSTSWLLCTC